MQHLIPNISIPSLWPLLFVLVLLKFMSLVSDSNKMHANSEFVFFILWCIWGVGCSMTATVFSMLYRYPLFSQWSIFCDHCNIVKKKKHLEITSFIIVIKNLILAKLVHEKQIFHNCFIFEKVATSEWKNCA